MLGPDAVEKAQYLPTGPVKPTQQSDRDKKQKFKDALKEKLDDEQGGKGKQSPEDELVLAEEPKDEFKAEDESETGNGEESRIEPETPPETEDERTDETDQEKKPRSGSSKAKHIDVKA